MTLPIIISMLLLTMILPIGAFYLGERKASRFKNSLAINIISFFGVLLFSTIFVFSGNAYAAEVAAEAVAARPINQYGDMATGLAFLSAALSVGLGSIGAGVATGQAASAALGALSENEGVMGKALIFVALAEGVAIYGLIIAFMILQRV